MKNTDLMNLYAVPEFVNKTEMHKKQAYLSNKTMQLGKSSSQWAPNLARADTAALKQRKKMML